MESLRTKKKTWPSQITRYSPFQLSYPPIGSWVQSRCCRPLLLPTNPAQHTGTMNENWAVSE
jgi:hypothetical protein